MIRTPADQQALRDQMRVTVLTDQDMCAPGSLLSTCAAALEGGAKTIQLRMKGATASEILRVGRVLREMTLEHEALLIINDRADIAVSLGADGVHVGPHDPSIGTLREHFGQDLILGASCDDPGGSARLEAAGADYIGCGAVFPTRTKEVGDQAIGAEGVRAVVDAVSIPVIAIGGISRSNVGVLHGTGAAGIAVIGAVMGTEDPRAETALLVDAVRALTSA